MLMKPTTDAKVVPIYTGAIRMIPSEAKTPANTTTRSPGMGGITFSKYATKEISSTITDGCNIDTQSVNVWSTESISARPFHEQDRGHGCHPLFAAYEAQAL